MTFGRKTTGLMFLLQKLYIFPAKLLALRILILKLMEILAVLPLRLWNHLKNLFFDMMMRLNLELNLWDSDLNSPWRAEALALRVTQKQSDLLDFATFVARVVES
ncbi:transmembrane protein, putative [Medicago truncatula]|uniref:Transmembrane protein, putative n=1 Tax=Medicago truncatula TaxID=3880 RepID=G7JTL1_MEDTR|nr:transmembrane protein, putative [Medicago truncatula]